MIRKGFNIDVSMGKSGMGRRLEGVILFSYFHHVYHSQTTGDTEEDRVADFEVWPHYGGVPSVDEIGRIRDPSQDKQTDTVAACHIYGVRGGLVE